jgi:pimeloyl-ACP methyl ester carboxylesterase
MRLFRGHLHAVKRIIALVFLILPSCGLLPRSVPIPVATLLSGKANGAELVVFLPGRWSRVEEFEKEGFLAIASKRWPNARLVAADLHIGYYRNQSMARRLHEDVILPARRSGVKSVRIVGISMGGLGALIYDAEYPGQADELILLSPFLGEESALQEIEASGELKNWRPAPPTERDYSRKLWLRLRENRLMKSSPTEVLLGCGTEDRLAASSRLFAREFLESDAQEWLAGGHDWPTWRLLFESLVRN